jgi:biopolymer transport protein ExbB/TolQ
MDLPTWLIDILRQFPIVTVIGFAVWYAVKKVQEKEIRLEERADKHRQEIAAREDRLRQEARDDRDAEIKRLLDGQREAAEIHEKLLTTKDEQIEHLTKQLAALNRKLLG